jgi:hypothetical protein
MKVEHAFMNSAAAQRKRGDRAGEWKEASENFGCDVRLVCTSNNYTSGIQWLAMSHSVRCLTLSIPQPFCYWTSIHFNT